MSKSPRYGNQRPKKTPPHVSLADVRRALDLTIDEVIERIKEHEEFQGLSTTRGAISAIESGTRGPSVFMLRALCVAYGLRDGAIVTNYEPKDRKPSIGHRSVA